MPAMVYTLPPKGAPVTVFAVGHSRVGWYRGMTILHRQDGVCRLQCACGMVWAHKESEDLAVCSRCLAHSPLEDPRATDRTKPRGLLQAAADGRSLVFDALDALVRRYGWNMRVAHGAAGVDADEPDWRRLRGADRLIQRWCTEHNVPVQGFPARWRALGPAAGRLRDARVVPELAPDVGLVLTPGREVSNLAARVAARRIPVFEVRVSDGRRGFIIKRA